MISRRDLMIEELAYEVLEGTFGNGEERVWRLGPLYREVQSKVDAIVYMGRRERPLGEVRIAGPHSPL